MTSLPPNQPKIPLGNPRNSEAAPFFQSSKGHSPTPAQSFDSLIPKNESKKSRNEELEEAEAARKRKKTAPPTEAASSASTSPTDPFAPTTTTPDIASPLLAAKPNDLSIQLPPESRQNQTTKVDEKADPSSTLATQKGTNAPISDNASLSAINNSPGDAPTLNPEPLAAETLPSSREADLSTAEDAMQAQLEPTEIPNKENSFSHPENQDRESSDDASGMENATNDPEMISLATLDGIEAGTATIPGREPAITSANRIPQVGTNDRAAVSPIPDSSFSHLASGNAAPLSETQGPNSAQNPASQAASLLKSLPAELDKFQQSGRSQIQLELPVGENESVKIRLSIRGGEIRSTFITESPELREALQKAWPDFTASHRDRGLRFRESHFQEAMPRNDTASDQGRQRTFQPDYTPSTSQSPLPTKAATTSIAPETSNRPGSLNLWA